MEGGINREKNKNKHKEHDMNGTGYLLKFRVRRPGSNHQTKKEKVHGKTLDDASHESRPDRPRNINPIKAFIILHMAKKARKKRKKPGYNIARRLVYHLRAQQRPPKITLEKQSEEKRTEKG